MNEAILEMLLRGQDDEYVGNEVMDIFGIYDMELDRVPFMYRYQ